MDKSAGNRATPAYNGGKVATYSTLINIVLAAMKAFIVLFRQRRSALGSCTQPRHREPFGLDRHKALKGEITFYRGEMKKHLPVK